MPSLQIFIISPHLLVVVFRTHTAGRPAEYCFNEVLNSRTVIHPDEEHLARTLLIVMPDHKIIRNKSHNFFKYPLLALLPILEETYFQVMVVHIHLAISEQVIAGYTHAKRIQYG